MEKIKIGLSVILPGIPDEKDACVQRMITGLTGRQGIDRVHFIPGTGGTGGVLCFHYDPEQISVEHVENLARQAGAEISNRYHHFVILVLGIRHQRQTRLLETEIRKRKGILSVSVSASGVVVIETDAKLIHDHDVYELLKSLGLDTGKEKEKRLSVSEEYRNGEGHTHSHEEEHTKTYLEGYAHSHRQGHAQPSDEGHTHSREEGSHAHIHEGVSGRNTELIFSIASGALLGVGFGLSFLPGMPGMIPLLCYMAAYFFGGFFTAKEAVRTIRNGGFEIDFLMLVAAAGAAFLGNWMEGALLLFLFSLGHALEHFAMEKARKSIAALTDLTPKTALLKEGDQTKEVGIGTLKKGDVIIVRPNTKIAADGVIVKGSSSIDQAPITGESIPVDKTALEDAGDLEKAEEKHKVFAGTMNGNGALEVMVAREAGDSTLDRLVKMVNEAQTQKSPTQRFTDRFERFFVPFVLVLVLLLCFAFLVVDETFSQSFYRAMSVLVAASPCALAISTPSAVLSGVARAARSGVLIKGGRPLDDLGTLTALAFDKTGTLTEGKPRLTHVIPFKGWEENELLEAVVAVEALSDHPIAKAIVRDGKERLGNRMIPQAGQMEAVLGRGVKAYWKEQEIMIGNLSLFIASGIQPDKPLARQVKELEEAGHTTMVAMCDGAFIGVIAVMDTPRKEAAEVIRRLQQAGIRKMVMLTGDNQQVAEAVAARVGIAQAKGGLLPDGKVAAIKQLVQEENKVAMIGDGVNDAPAMANSTVGIAMGAAGSDVALETADIALMGDDLLLLPFAIGLSRKAKTIIRQNLVISLGMVALLIPLTILGIASIGPAVVAHEGSTLLVVFNALRLLGYRRG